MIVFILERPDAEKDYSPERIAGAKARLPQLSQAKRDEIERTLIDWVPAREATYDRAGFKRVLAQYRGLGVEELRANLIAFVREIAEVAEEAGVRLAIHPDDPSFPLFGLPRVMSSADDVRKLFAGVSSPACGITLCTGSFGSNRANDLPAMAKEFGERIHFAHLRNVKHEPDGSFYEADHLAGDTDMLAVVAELLTQEETRRAKGRADAEIPMRPDHGHLMGRDIGQPANPGYSFIGRLKGLAELRGVMQTVEAFRSGRLH